jgi:predicted MFS family arabinose efflux permease
MLAFVGGTPIGAPLVGALTSHFGARAGMTVCGVLPVLAVVVVAAARRRRAEPEAAPGCGADLSVVHRL